MKVPKNGEMGYASFAQEKISEKQNFINEQEQLMSKCSDCPCKKRPPFTFILGSTASARFRHYATKIGTCGLDHIGNGTTYTPEGAKDLLDILTTEGYDGFRAYFAVYPERRRDSRAQDSGYRSVPGDEYGKLMLIYVPTRGDDSGRHLDDITHCMIVMGTKAVNIHSAIASMWIRKAEKTVLSRLEDSRRKRHPKFLETHSLWFNNNFVRNTKYNNGLKDILECRMCCKDITGVSVGFGAFLGLNVHRYANKLTVVFGLSKGESTSFVSLFSGDLSPIDAKSAGIAPAAVSGGSDTGKPCPPPSKCNVTTIGSMLPVQQ